MKCKMVYQHDQNDCGAACLAIIASFYGLKMPIATWREYTNTGREGVSIYGIVEGAQKAGFIAESQAGSMDELLSDIRAGKVSFPVIANIVNVHQQSHFVVIQKISKGRVYLLDPDLGKRNVSLKEFDEMWLGYIVTLIPGEDFISGDYTKGTIKRFYLLVKGQYYKLVGAFFLSLIIAGLGIITAFIFQTVVDQFGVTAGYYQLADKLDEDLGEDCEDEDCDDDHHKEISKIDKIVNQFDEGAFNYEVYFIGAIILYCIQYLIQYFRSWLMVSVSTKIDLDLSMKYYGHVIRLPMKYVEHRRTGEYLSRFSDASLVKDAISSISVTVMLDSVLAIGCGIILYFQNSLMFLVAVGVMMIYFIVLAVFHRPIEKINRACMNKSADVESYVKEVFDGVETIKTNALENSVSDKGEREYSMLTRLIKRSAMIATAQDCVVEFVEMLGNIIIVWIGFGFVLEGETTIGSLLAFYIMLSYFTSPIKSLFLLQPTLQTALVAADRLNDILDMEIETNSEEKYFPENWRTIDCKNVTFRYGEKNSILNDINLHICRGQRIAIIGNSGSGKTTLAKIIIGLHQPDNGQIYLDDCNLGTISMTEIRTHFAYLRHDPFLFADTIRNNLSMGNNVSDEHLSEVCRKCFIEDFIQSLPYGYDTLLSEMAHNVSSGQRQRLAIARALLLKPSVLILDEATSNIDSTTEKLIKDELFRDKNLTIIMITHKLESVVKFDNIVVLDKGNIIEMGTHEHLLNKNGFYREMWDKQN